MDCDWRYNYMKDKRDKVAKYYKEFDIDSLLQTKKEFEDVFGQELGYQMFKGCIVEIGLSSSIEKAEKILSERR